MRAWLFPLICILGVGGWFAYQSHMAPPYGASPEDPLGTFEKLDAHLAAKLGFERGAPAASHGAGIVPGGTVYAYRNNKKRVTPGFKKETIHLTLGPDGRVLSIGGFFYTQPHSPWTPASRVSQFLMNRWKELTGDPEPQFKKLRTPGYDTYAGFDAGDNTHKGASFSDGRIDGAWTRSGRGSFGTIAFTLAPPGAR